jgi:hypothetical protein
MLGNKMMAIIEVVFKEVLPTTVIVYSVHVTIFVNCDWMKLMSSDSIIVFHTYMKGN